MMFSLMVDEVVRVLAGTAPVPSLPSGFRIPKLFELFASSAPKRLPDEALCCSGLGVGGVTAAPTTEASRPPD